MFTWCAQYKTFKPFFFFPFLALILTQNTFLDILQEQVHKQNDLFISRCLVSMGIL